MAKVLVLLVVLSNSYIISCYHIDTVTDMRSQIQAMIRSEPIENNRNPNDFQFLGGLVRLSFHDCVGDRCDGCVNLANPENAGLGVYIDRLEALYNTLEVDGEPVEISRADFWALAGIEAASFAAEIARSPVPEIEFRYGRVDCPNAPSTDENHTFPSALGDIEHVLQFFDDQFGFDEKEATAILGAHTLGRAHRDASGFVHPWVRRKNNLDNEFYTDLNDPGKEWAQRSIGRNEDRKWFWENAGTSNLMLNVDMALIRDMNIIDDQGQVDCNYATCPVANATVKWVEAFAANNTLWIMEFAKAFQKMIESGWDGQLSSVDMATTPAPTTTTASSEVQLPNITSGCPNNKILNPKMDSITGYFRADSRRVSIVDNDDQFFPGLKMLQLICSPKHQGVFQRIRFTKGENVNKFSATLWSKLRTEHASDDVSSNGYGLRVDIRYFGGDKETMTKQFDVTTPNWQRAVVRHSDERRINMITVWARCENDLDIAHFGEMTLLADPWSCVCVV